MAKRARTDDEEDSPAIAFDSIAVSAHTRHLMLNEHLRLSLHHIACYGDPLVVLVDRRHPAPKLCCYLKQRIERIAATKTLRFRLPDASSDGDGTVYDSILNDLPHGGTLRVHSWRNNHVLMLFVLYHEEEEQVGISLVLQFIDCGVLF
jgi:hypothetical protein